MTLSKEKGSNSLLSRMILRQSNDFWNLHAAWFRFVDGSMESLSQRSHKHMLYELHYVLEGQLDIHLPHEQTFHVQSGHFLIVPPQTMHSIIDAQPPSYKLVSGFDIISEAPRVQRALEAIQTGCCLRESKTLRQLILTLQTKMESFTLTSSAVTPQLAQCIFLEMIELLCPDSPEEKNVLKNSLNDRRLEIALQFIQNNLQADLTSPQVAEHLGISARHLNRLCHTIYGCSINQLILRERMEKAKLLLESTSFSLTDISEMLGYSSVYAFIRAFKGIAGLSPGLYQKDVCRR